MDEEFLLGQWSANEVGAIEASPYASLSLTIEGNVVWREGLEEVFSCRPVLPPGVVRFSSLVKTGDRRFRAIFHLNSLEALENLVCPLVGQARFAHGMMAHYDGPKTNANIYLSDGLIREAFEVNAYIHEPNEIGDQVFHIGPTLALALAHPSPVGLSSETHLLPWTPDLPSCFQLVNTEQGFHRSVVPSADAWFDFPHGANIMRDRYVYETIIPLGSGSLGDSRVYPFDCLLPSMTLRFLEVITPGPWRLVSDRTGNGVLNPWSNDGKMAFDLFVDTPAEARTNDANPPLFCGHPANGISPGRYEVFGLMYMGSGQAPPAVRIVAEGTRLLSRRQANPELGVGYTFIGGLRETEGSVHFPPTPQLLALAAE